MRSFVPPVAVALVLGLGGWGLLLDAARPLPQAELWTALQLASLAGGALGALALGPRLGVRAAAGALALMALLAWRVSYFPIMVFSGHVASIAEWLELLVGLPVVVYPVFLLCVLALHTVAGAGAAFLVRPPSRLAYAVVVPAFAVATAVSFSNATDLALLPDRARQLAAPVPPAVGERANPYLPVLGSPAYAPHVNLMLLAAGLTYETIPPSPWATTVKAVLEDQFNRKPVASTQDRVVEHYLAYHAAHSRVGCRGFSACPVEPAAAPAVASEPP